jgi:hypothetical protein
LNAGTSSETMFAERGDGLRSEHGAALVQHRVRHAEAQIVELLKPALVDDPGGQYAVEDHGGLLDDGQVRRVLDHDERSSGVLKNPLELHAGRGRIHRHGLPAGGPDGEVEHSPLVPGACHQRDPSARLQPGLDQALGGRGDVLRELEGGHRQPALVGTFPQGYVFGHLPGVVEGYVGQGSAGQWRGQRLRPGLADYSVLAQYVDAGEIGQVRAPAGGP